MLSRGAAMTCARVSSNRVRKQMGAGASAYPALTRPNLGKVDFVKLCNEFIGTVGWARTTDLLFHRQAL
jgi:hypothetical protein